MRREFGPGVGGLARRGPAETAARVHSGKRSPANRSGRTATDRAMGVGGLARRATDGKPSMCAQGIGVPRKSGLGPRAASPSRRRLRSRACGTAGRKAGPARLSLEPRRPTGFAHEPRQASARNGCRASGIGPVCGGSGAGIWVSPLPEVSIATRSAMLNARSCPKVMVALWLFLKAAALASEPWNSFATVAANPREFPARESGC